jgi:hypothetical protein
MIRILTAILLMANSAATFAQQNAHLPYIEVSGTAEMQVVPDEIHISIVLRERGNGNNKVSVEQQELDLKASVKALGIDTGDLSLSDAMADLVPKKFREDDVIARKGYMLKVADAEMVRKVFMELDRLQIEDAFIHHVSHSKEVEYRRTMRIAAITDAKDKADYMLAAIGERTGQALEVIETPVERKRPGTSGAFDRIYGGTTSKRLVEMNDNYRALDVGFSRITISANVGCVFAIAPK